MPLTLIALSLVAAPTGPATGGSVAPICQDNRVRGADSPRRARPHVLGEEPLAHHLFTVLRTEGGCSRPVPVSDHLVGAPTPGH